MALAQLSLILNFVKEKAKNLEAKDLHKKFFQRSIILSISRETSGLKVYHKSRES